MMATGVRSDNQDLASTAHPFRTNSPESCRYV